MLPIAWCAFRLHKVRFTVLAIVPLMVGALVLASFDDVLALLLQIIASGILSSDRRPRFFLAGKPYHIITERSTGATRYNTLSRVGTIPNNHILNYLPKDIYLRGDFRYLLGVLTPSTCFIIY
jgi:hypothetical protein